MSKTTEAVEIKVGDKCLLVDSIWDGVVECTVEEIRECGECTVLYGDGHVYETPLVCLLPLRCTEDQAHELIDHIEFEARKMVAKIVDMIEIIDCDE